MDKPCSYCICDCDKACVYEIQEKTYQQGKADGVKNFAKWVLRSPKIWQEDYLLLADVETLVHDYEQGSERAKLIQTKGE